MAGIPAAMLARGGPLPHGDAWAFEVKWDGFRAIVSTVNGLYVSSRRGWALAELVPELAPLPAGLVLDGELVAWDEDGLPSFPLLCERILHHRHGIPVSYLVFDVLEVEGRSTLRQPFRERRAILDALELPTRTVVSDVYADGEALFQVVCERGMEGVVAKRWSSPYRPGERGWIKVKNPAYWRLGDERELARRPRPRATI